MELLPFEKTPILIVDDDKGLLSSMEAALISAGMPEPTLLSDSRQVMDVIGEQHFSLVLLDLIMPHIGGIELLQQIKEIAPETECLIITAIDDVSTAVQAIKLGAYDYLVKPVDRKKLVVVIKNALERYAMRRELAFFKSKPSFASLEHPDAFADMVAADETMARIFNQAEAIAPTDYSLIITGESGTGKELLARTIHSLSTRADGPFVPVNMAAFNHQLFEDEFFGHVKGAFTGALSDKQGFFEAAHTGTLFLDEVTELDTNLQAKLLRVLQEGEFYRLGSARPQKADVRIIAATNRDISEEIQKKAFREDLFYRLNMFAIHIPPLRMRPKDILPLARHFLQVHASRNKKKITSLAADLEEVMLRYYWPGNVRELESVMAKAVILEPGSILSQASVYGLNVFSEKVTGHTDDGGLISLAKMEKMHIKRVLDFTDGNRTRAAVILGIDLRTLQRKLKKLTTEDGKTPYTTA